MGKWNFETLSDEISKYETLKEFRMGHNSAYGYARKHPRSEELFANLKKDRKWWCHDSVAVEAMKYSERYEFQKGSNSAYNYALKHDLLDTLFPHSVKETVSWDYESVREEAAKYKHRTDFKLNASGAHKHAYENGFLSELFGETFNTPECDNDCLYIWKVKGLPVYKIGITSNRLGDRRIKYVCRKGGLECEWHSVFRTENARQIESKLLGVGRPFEFEEKFSGSTEFRNMSNEELETCLMIIESDTQERK